MDMSGMGGMDMGSEGMFTPVNKHIARVFWYLILAACLFRGLAAIISYLYSRLCTIFASDLRNRRQWTPSRPTNYISQTYATFITILRELTYPTLKPFQGRFAKYFSLPPLGHCLLLSLYWLVILSMLWSNVILPKDSSIYGYKWEIVGFRAAWVSVTQLPLIYALSAKFNVISLLTGVSYERLNWLHRWVSRTVFLTIIVHWAYFFREWVLSEFVAYELALMPMVKYGFGAWAVIGWMVITGWGFFREIGYELWVCQHIASAGVLLWLVYVHVPSYAQYNVWLSIGFVVFDRVARGIWSITRNLHVMSLGRSNGRKLGFEATAQALLDGYTKVVIKDVDFRWRAGQHIFLSIPALGFIESHPFTIASAAPTGRVTSASQTIELYLKSHGGFTKRLHNKASQSPSNQTSTHRAFISGAWGTPPLTTMNNASSLVFISGSTGASYCMPLLEHAIHKASFVKDVHFYWMIRHESQLDWFKQRLETALSEFEKLEVRVKIVVFITGTTHIPEKQQSVPGVADHGEVLEKLSMSSTERTESTAADSIEKIPATKPLLTTVQSVHSSQLSSSNTSLIEEPSTVQVMAGRPSSWDDLIRPVVESATGETAIVGCGSQNMMAEIRTYVASLSDERAVHKGTGAQGIFLFTENYGW